MGSMKTASTMFNLMGVVIVLIYTYNLLDFIRASSWLWSLWLMSIIVSIVSALLGQWARDEYYAEQFKKVLDKAWVD